MNLTRRLIMFLLGVAYFRMTAATTCPYLAPECVCDIESSTCYGNAADDNLNLGYRCKSSKVYCDGLFAVPTLDTVDATTAVDSVVFNTGKIVTINKNSLPTGLSTIQFTDIPLTGISDDIFENSLGTLHTLHIDGAKFTKIPTTFYQLNNLRSLTVINTHIVNWDINKFLAMSSLLVYLDLTNTKSDDITKLLSTQTKLNYLDLSGNTVTDVNGTKLVEIPTYPLVNTVTTLKLRSIGLTVFPDLTNFINLVSIDLSDNEIPDWTTHALPRTVTTLILKGNMLSSVPVYITNLQALSVLDLSSNEITEFKSEDFPLNLTSLDLSNNRINEITDASFSKNFFLQSLDLSKNLISTISQSSFRSLHSLRSLIFKETIPITLPLSLMYLTKLHSVTFDVVRCPCPTPSTLVEWYISYNLTLGVEGNCDNSISLEDYLNGYCQQPTQAITIPNIVDHAPAPITSWVFKYLSVFPLVVTYLNRF